ncbi:hypothetical protein H3Z85_11535 [Chryseobacterium indologenes]|uniref:hypothetical protein n=1 Tax=Chryseobacterium indologenes TaxID=253 RepID=UPI0003E07752|nr:hypothetical protein [Chryseobacterium indologenes]QPQ50186.1 hypothetical protein H3Z85_11535 [Chryseobacterium indologenes]GAE66001.1 hypothetical protein CIN01S_13_00900 [Chryseobacterium indologenes NBRC 14944]SFK35154.1 hypothetical protein SAMN05421692_4136 [Chryseobacterium indologenes]SUX52780.1 Uncharacterised protein [Chryseobacterium indologenes]
MNYTLEELKKQLISLNYEKENEIEMLDKVSLDNYLDKQLDEINYLIAINIDNMSDPKIKNIFDLVKSKETTIVSGELLDLIFKNNLLYRIKYELSKI